MNWDIYVTIKHTEFSGKSRRKEHWMLFIFNFLISMALSFITIFIRAIFEIEFINTVPLIYSLIILIPSIAFVIQRIHEVGLSGWRFLLAIVNFTFLFLDNHLNENEYDVNPQSF